MSDLSPDFQYIPTPTGLLFHESDARIKLIHGPVGSGKTIDCIMDIIIDSAAQHVAPVNNVRYSRWAIIRGTYGEILNTTKISFEEVLPESCGQIDSGKPLNGIYRIPLADGTKIQLELIFYALPDLDSALKYKSSNWSGAYINEATEIPKDVFDWAATRVGRFPPKSLGGCRHPAIIADFNQPNPGHWLWDYINIIQRGEAPTWEYFKQPPAAFRVVSEDGAVTYEVNPDAENLENVGGVQFYQEQINMLLVDGRTDKIESEICLENVPVKDGKPVWPGFKREYHVLRHVVQPRPYTPVLIGYDTSGQSQAAVFVQWLTEDWVILDELIGEEMGFETFVDQLIGPLLTEKYPTCEVIVAPDPSDPRNNMNSLKPSTFLRSRGYTVEPAWTNDIKTRIRAVETLINRFTGGLKVSPNCDNVIGAMSGAYKYRKLRISGSLEGRYESKPDKNSASHIADAVQYAALRINKSAQTDTRKMSPEQQAKRQRLRRALTTVM